MPLLTSVAEAQTPPTAEQIIERLKSGQPAPARGRTRGLSAPGGYSGPTPSPVSPAATGDGTQSVGEPIEPKVDRFFVEPGSNLSKGERNEVAAIAQARPAIDLTIYFDFDSAAISPKAVPALVELGKALTSDSLKQARFLLAGHTDAKGSSSYNLKLSQRRADAIREFLAKQFRVDERRLLSIGYGEEQLKDAANPFADENRRVQVVNFGG
ncbi:MAG: OmpA family protein [Hyphomicrobiaceae bacterium]